MKHRAIRLATLATLASPGSLACDKPAKVGADTPTGPATKDTASSMPTSTDSLGATPPVVAPPPAADARGLAASSNALGFDLYGKIRSRAGHLALSPSSISAALAMT